MQDRLFPTQEVSDVDYSGQKLITVDNKRVPFPFFGENSFVSRHGGRLTQEAIQAWKNGKRPDAKWDPDVTLPEHSDLSEETDSASECSEDLPVHVPLIEEDGPEHLQWYLPLSPKSRLHIKSDAKEGLYCACGRTLTRAEEGIGVGPAFSTARKWSPRCYQILESKGFAADWIESTNEIPGWQSSESESEK